MGSHSFFIYLFLCLSFCMVLSNVCNKVIINAQLNRVGNFSSYFLLVGWFLQEIRNHVMSCDLEFAT